MATSRYAFAVQGGGGLDKQIEGYCADRACKCHTSEKETDHVRTPFPGPVPFCCNVCARIGVQE